ncbi:hypothetical protein Q1695_014162 [Nippostrongylus brasiliensis]|nr:hypothetical protein Q1695_014162 [Nippostrongylus brasiliensis]
MGYRGMKYRAQVRSDGFVVFSRHLAESSPYYELIRSQNKEVLFLYEPADEIYDNALITSGLLKDSSGMVQRLNKLLTELAASGKSTILTP